MSSISLFTNVSGLRANNAYASFTRQLNSTMEKLATGKQINRASDDPSGMQAVSQMKARLADLNKRLENLDHSDAYLGAREGAQSVMSDLLIDLQSNITRAANTGALTDAEKDALQVETDSIIKSIDHLAHTSTFKGQQILSGFNSSNLGITSTQVPDGVDENGDPVFRTQTYSLHDLMSGGKLNLVDGDLAKAQESITAAIKNVAGSRGAIGNQMKANESERRVLMSELESTEAARSLIEDADFAKETANLVREQTLQSASLFVMQLAAEQKQQMVESLLEGTDKSSTR